MKSRILEIALLVLVLAQTILSLVFPVYQDTGWVKDTWFGNDLITLVLVVPLLLLSLVSQRRGFQRLFLGILGYLIYNDLFYLLGTEVNRLFLVYALIVVLAAFLLIRTLATDNPRRQAVGSFDLSRRALLPGVVFLVIGGGLGAVWVAFTTAHAFFGTPLPTDPAASRLVAALDLVLMVAPLTLAGIGLLRRRREGVILAWISGPQAFLYLVVLSTNAALMSLKAGNFPGELVLWGPLALVMLVGVVALASRAARPLGPGVLLLALGSCATYQPAIEGQDLARVPVPNRGEVVVVADFRSQALAQPRNLYLYLPAGYQESRESYPTIYFNDGGGLFSSTSPSGGGWQLDLILDALIDQGRIPKVIVVGVSSTADRTAEYVPYVIRDNKDYQNPHPLADRYLAFLETELIPFIEKTYRVGPRPEDRTIAGSSFGGLVSLFAVLKKPEVFGNALAFSPSLWPGSGGVSGREPVIEDFGRIQGEFRPRVYFDMGAREAAWGYPRDVSNRFFTVLSTKGKADSLRFVFDPTGVHHPVSWTRRAPDALVWLLNR